MYSPQGGFMPGGKGCPMKKSKNKYSPWPAVALCLVFLALRIVDLALFTDPETSFPTLGDRAGWCGGAACDGPQGG